MTWPRGEPVGAVFGFTRDMMYLARAAAARLSVLRLRSFPGPRFAMSFSPHTRRIGPRCRIDLRAADRIDSPDARCDGHSGARLARLRGRRRAGHRRPAGQRARRRVYSGHGRQRLPPVHHRPREAAQHPQEPVVRCGGPAGRTGAFGPIRSSIFRPWWATRSTTCRACRSSDPKLARELLQKFDTLDNLFEHVDEVAGQEAAGESSKPAASRPC